MARNDVLPTFCAIVGLILLGIGVHLWTAPIRGCFLHLPGTSPTVHILAEREKIVLKNRGFIIRKAPMEDGKCGEVRDKVISLAPGLSEREQLWVLYHERAHVILGHTTRGSDPTQEVEAETVAVMVEQRWNLGGVEQSYGYIAGWIRSPYYYRANTHKITLAYDQMIREIHE